MRSSKEGNDTSGRSRVQDYFRVRGHYQLALPFGCHAAKFVVGLLLKDDMQMRIWLVQEEYGRRPRIKEGQKQQCLMKSASS